MAVAAEVAVAAAVAAVAAAVAAGVDRWSREPWIKNGGRR